MKREKTSIDLETFLVVTADWTLLAVASTLADILRKLRDWFFCLMAFSAWILATWGYVNRSSFFKYISPPYFLFLSPSLVSTFQFFLPCHTS